MDGFFCELGILFYLQLGVSWKGGIFQMIYVHKFDQVILHVSSLVLGSVFAT